MEVSQEQLLQIIGRKQVEIESLTAQLRAVADAYEAQRQILAAQNQPPDPEGKTS